MIEITNQQKIKRVNSKQLRKDLNKIFTLLDISSKKASFLLCDNKTLRKLNNLFFKKNTYTDVISFPLADEFEPDYLGEVVVSLERAAQVSERYSHAWYEELLFYCLHGILHFLGYDDRTLRKRKRMEKKQEEIMQKLRLNKVKQS